MFPTGPGFEREWTGTGELFQRRNIHVIASALKLQGPVPGRRRCLHPFGPNDLAVIPIAGGVPEHVALPLFKAIQRQRVIVRLKPVLRRKLLVVTGAFGDANTVYPSGKEKTRGRSTRDATGAQEGAMSKGWHNRGLLRRASLLTRNE